MAELDKVNKVAWVVLAFAGIGVIFGGVVHKKEADEIRKRREQAKQRGR